MMAPGSAWHDDAFRAYLLIVAVLLSGAGLALATLTYGLRKDVRSVWVTYRSWLVMAPLALGAVLAGRVGVAILFGALAVLGFKEFARATGLYRDWWMTGAAYLAIAACTGATLAPDPNTGRPGWYGLFMTLPAYATALILLVPIARNRAQGQLQSIALAVTGFVYIGWMFGHVAFLATVEAGCGYLLYLLFAVEVNDVAAFTCGRVFGRRQLRSQISPRKTWEGALGALAVSMALPWALRFSFPHFGTAQLLLTGAIVGIGGQLGDLAISVIKRDVGVKDMGAVIPGHGGILDRIDSLIYVAPLFLHMTDYTVKHW